MKHARHRRPGRPRPPWPFGPRRRGAALHATRLSHRWLTQGASSRTRGAAQGLPAEQRPAWTWPSVARSGSRGLLVACLCLLLLNVTGHPAWADDINVTPSWQGIPGQDKVQTILNVTAQVALACCVAACLLGGAAMGVGRVIGSYQAGNRGLMFFLGGGAGAIAVGIAPAFVRWLS